MWECYIVPRSFWATYHNDVNRYSPKMKKLGGGGPLPISHAELLPEMEPFRKMLTRTWTSVGEKVSDSIYDGEMNGFTHCVHTIYRGQRSGSYLFLKNNPTSQSSQGLIRNVSLSTASTAPAKASLSSTAPGTR